MCRLRLVVLLTVSVGLVFALLTVRQPQRLEACSSRHPPYRYANRRASFTTSLIHKGPAPRSKDEFTGSSDWRPVAYRSEHRLLKAWISYPSRPINGALVYFHGKFTVRLEDVRNASAFVGAGYVTLLPLFRGEGGNEGDFEMYMGEVTDAVAAAEYLQVLAGDSRVYGFGHSAGGVIALLLSLRPGTPYRILGSVGGTYSPAHLCAFGQVLPYENTLIENEMRSALPHLDQFTIPHYAFVGKQDPLSNQLGTLASEIRIRSSKLRLSAVLGDHHSSVPPAIDEFLKILANANSSRQATDFH